MGLTSNIVNKVRRYFERDKQARGAELKRGDDFVRYQQPGPHGTGYQQLSDELRLDNDLMARYADYEEISDYPEAACIIGTSRIGILRTGSKGKSSSPETGAIEWVSIADLIARRKRNPTEKLYTFAVDHEGREIVPTEFKGPMRTGRKVPVVKVTFVDGIKEWSIRSTPDHLFMLRDGSYKEARFLTSADVLMPLKEVPINGYAGIRNPWGSKQYIHRLVGKHILSEGDMPRGIDVHHMDDNKWNADPANLEVLTRSQHCQRHPATKKERKKTSQRFAKLWADPEYRRTTVQKMAKNGAPSVLVNNNAKPKGLLSDKHRAAIAKGHRLVISKSVVEAAIRSSASLNEAARKVGVSWNTIVRRMDEFDISREALGSSAQNIHPGDPGYSNHCVFSVEPDGVEDVYDLEVPKYHNFACEHVFVHNSALDVYADDSTTPDMTRSASIWAESKDRVVQIILDDLLNKRLRLEDDIWPKTRNTCKYGNTFGEILATNEGVIGINYLPTPTMRRVETKKGTIIGYVQDPKGQFNLTNAEVRQAIEQAQAGEAPSKISPSDENVVIFEPWEIVHWRLRSGNINAPYGEGIYEPVRWIFRRLVMFEDSALIYKLTRSPARFAYYVDVGELPSGQAMAYVNNVKRAYKKTAHWNPGTKFLDLRHNPLGMNEDIWLPMRGGQESTRVDVLAGPDYQVVDDLEYFRSKMFSALKVPRAYLGFEPDQGRQTLSQIDVRFAKTVMRIQREIVNGYKQIARLHLAILGIDPDQVEWTIKMNVPSHIFELAQIELMSAKMDVADRLEAWMPKTWILEHIFDFSREDAEFHAKSKEDEGDGAQRRNAALTDDLARKYPLGVPEAPEMPLPPEGEGAVAAGPPQEESRRAKATTAKLVESVDRLERELIRRHGKLAEKLDAIKVPVQDLQREMRVRRNQGRGLRRVV